MERLTKKYRGETGKFYMKCSENCKKEDFSCEDCTEFQKMVDRFGSIEDILGDDYDLDRLREMAEADRDGRCVVLNGKDKQNKTIRDLVRLIHWVCASVRKHDFSPFRIAEGAPENTFPVVSKYDQLIEEHEDEIYTAFIDEEVNKSTIKEAKANDR